MFKFDDRVWYYILTSVFLVSVFAFTLGTLNMLYYKFGCVLVQGSKTQGAVEYECNGKSYTIAENDIENDVVKCLFSEEGIHSFYVSKHLSSYIVAVENDLNVVQSLECISCICCGICTLIAIILKRVGKREVSLSEG